MASTLAEKLASVQAAIAAVEGGAQSYTDDDGHNITYPPLEVLYLREDRLQRKIDGQSTGRIKVVDL